MEWMQAFWLALVQGVTEFLPISSSGHLALFPSVFGWVDQGLAFDVAVHVGTLVAVVCYFHKDLILIVGDWVKSITGGPTTVHSKLAWSIVFATIPVGLAGIFLEDIVSTVFRHPISIAWATIVFGVLLGWADRVGPKKRTTDSISWKDILVIGFAQALALIPGTSRSGVTITAGLAMGLTRDAAARFSFLMAIPVIVLAGIWQGKGLAEQAQAEPQTIQWGVLCFSVVVSAIVALGCIHYFLRYLQRFSMLPFVIYRIILGVILLIVFM